MNPESRIAPAHPQLPTEPVLLAQAGAGIPGIVGPLSAGQLLDRAFRLYRARFARVITLSALFLLPVSILSGVATGQMLNSQTALLQSIFAQPAGTAPLTVEGPFAGTPESILLAIITFLLGTFALML